MVFLMEVSLWWSHKDTPRIERRQRITKLRMRWICGSRSTAVSRLYRRVERTTELRMLHELGGNLDLPLGPTNVVE